MAQANPNNSAEILYGASGDVRDEVNAHALASTLGHYADETEIPGSLIISSIQKATRMINAHLEPVYSEFIPVTAVASVPVILDEISNDIAVYYVMRSARALLGNIPQDKRQDYFDDHMNKNNGTLILISENKLKIPEWSVSAPADAASTRESGRTAIFDLDADTSQGIDRRLADDIDQDRSR